MEGHLFSAALSGSFLASCLLFAAVGRALREPYMDEVFHLPQAQRFCQGHFTEWDPMITTLPGLYLLSVGVVKPAGWLLGWPEQVVCSIGALRFVNLLFSAGNFYLLHLLLCRTQPRHKLPPAGLTQGGGRRWLKTGSCAGKPLPCGKPPGFPPEFTPRQLCQVRGSTAMFKESSRWRCCAQTPASTPLGLGDPVLLEPPCLCHHTSPGSAGSFSLCPLHCLPQPPGSRCYHDAKQTSLDRRPTNVSWSPASPEPCPTRERERQAGSMDQPVNVHVQRGSNFRSQTFHILHPTMTLGLYSQRVKE
ncbi:dol-P-Glc:Glc(2)Man(9)GlcNAc(2)-PP-Dol alpha-1,2-glucosyltransferase isoform X5 [Erinaceus europaeus]|uniref:Dol-P-Glc:Glc(2)Man(9)GlcNAc(2)-PP-Dol alpha-1,2-glucosyltransferase n=1 Tax=Erinaceus europaeus TaxID=9365 RepID=A0ABM3XP80_ERIEU|nr:dol-P-Glc:Glc(2)Man(9)GlcNAc(2)-PP-Dol alpha-1,2-glucosyltransferase isoform X5 [Erinaceus europaeus]